MKTIKLNNIKCYYASVLYLDGFEPMFVYDTMNNKKLKQLTKILIEMFESALTIDEEFHKDKQLL